MREPQRKTIDGRVYEVIPIGAGRGMHLFARVAKIVGPALEKVTSLAEAEKAVFSMLASLVERLDGDNLEAICEMLADTTTLVNGDKRIALKEVFDLHFAGEYMAMFEWLRFALEVNFGPLVAALAKRVAKPVDSGAAAPSPSKSQTTSNGESIGSQ